MTPNNTISAELNTLVEQLIAGLQEPKSLASYKDAIFKENPSLALKEEPKSEREMYENYLGLIEAFLPLAFNSNDRVIEISKFIRNRTPGRDPKTIYVPIQAVNEFSKQTLTGIKINAFSERYMEGFSNPPRYLLTMLYGDKEHHEYYLIRDEIADLVTKIWQLADSVNLAEFYIFKPMIRHLSNMNPDTYLSYWDSWEQPDSTGLYYDQINDPMILKAFEQFVLSSFQDIGSNKPFTIIDVGAGRGRLAEKMILNAQASSLQEINYIFIEPNERQLANAKESLSPYINERCKITFIKTLEEIDPELKANCIISSGGPLNGMVVLQDKAKANINKLGQLLKEKGVIIATGHTPLLIKGKHFENAGLRPLAYATPCEESKQIEQHPYLQESRRRCGMFDHYQRYVFEKPAADEPEPMQRFSAPTLSNQN